MIEVHRPGRVVDNPSQGNPLNHHRLRQGTTRAVTMNSRRFTPYGTHRTYPSMRENTETGPSTQVLPLISCDAPQTTQPAGGTSETTTDTERCQTITEEAESTVSGFYCPPILRVTDCSFDVRRPRHHTPVTRGWDAPTASGTRWMCANCGRGRRHWKGSQDSQVINTR